MSEIKLPTTGRIVNYFPNGQDDGLGYNHSPKMAAIVAAGVDTAPDLSVFTRWDERPVVLKLSVQHKSAVIDFVTGQPVGPYWDWPEIK